MSVSIVTGLRAGRSGVRIPAGARDFSFCQMLRPALGPLQLSFQLVREVRSLEVKWPGREAGYWILSSAAEVPYTTSRPTWGQSLQLENYYYYHHHHRNLMTPIETESPVMCSMQCSVAQIVILRTEYVGRLKAISQSGSGSRRPEVWAHSCQVPSL